MNQTTVTEYLKYLEPLINSHHDPKKPKRFKFMAPDFKLTHDQCRGVDAHFKQLNLNTSTTPAWGVPGVITTLNPNSEVVGKVRDKVSTTTAIAVKARLDASARASSASWEAMMVDEYGPNWRGRNSANDDSANDSPTAQKKAQLFNLLDELRDEIGEADYSDLIQSICEH